MADKKITIDDLAVMIQKGFDNTATKEQFSHIETRIDKVEKRLDDVDKTLRAIKRDTANIVHKEDFDKLEGRVGILEGTCVLKKA